MVNDFWEANVNCPKCGSDQWKLATLVHAEGTTKVESLSLGGGAMVSNGDISPILASGLSFGHQQTDLAKIAAPPEKDFFKPPKTKTPVANSYFMKGLICGVAGFFGAVLNDFVDSSLMVAVTTLLLLTGMFYLIKSLWALLFGSEAAANRMVKSESKMKWNEEQERKIKDYEVTRICMRCGNKYLPQ